MKITTPATLEKSDFQLESFSKDKIPYARLLDAETVETKSGHLLQVIKIDGLVAETLDDKEIDQEKNIRNSLLRSITDSSLSLYFHTIRKKYNGELKGDYTSAFAQELHDKWFSNLKAKELYINEHYITVVKKPPTGKIRRLADLFSSLSSKVNSEARDIYRKKVHNDLNKVTDRMMNHLSRYDARKLSLINDHEPGIAFSEILAFLGELINLEMRKTIMPTADLSAYLPYKRIFFDKSSGRIALRSANNQSMFAGILSIGEYDKATAAGMLDHLLDIKSEMIIAQSFSFIDKGNAKKQIEEQQRNQRQSDDGATSETEKIAQTLDDLGSSNVSTGEHHLSILCKADSIDELEKSIAKIDAALNEIGILAIREDIGVKPAFFAMLPGNHAYITRRAIISSKNIAGFASLHNHAIGKITGNYWGDAVTLLETANRTPFAFNFHVLDVGNTFLIGPQGSGKTLLEAFLLVQSMRFGGRLIVFDKDRGLEIAVRTLDGSYSMINAGRRTGFAPFQMNDTPENRYLLTKLLKKIATMDGHVLADDDNEKIKNAIDGAYHLPKQDRIFRNVAAFLGMRRSGSLRARFDSWINDGEYAWVFDNEVDTLSLSNNVIGFDMTSILKDKSVCDPVYFYLFHRIEQMLDGTRTRIVVAEGWLALQDDEFRKQIQEWNSTPRKKEAFIVMDTQSPSDIAASEIGCKIIQETVTQIYFANPKASYEHYVEKFGLSQKEFEIVKNLDKETRYFLLKQGRSSVVVRADLSAMPDEIAILSGRQKSVELLDNIMKEVGTNKQDWMPRFLKEVTQVKL
jgi:type IV secretion system protein VirB4